MFSVSGKGIICKDPEIHYSKEGYPICRATAVNNDVYKDVETAHFTNLKLFGERAEDFAKEISKGCLIDVKSGILKHPVEEYRGRKIYKTEVTVLEWELIQKFEDKKKTPPPTEKAKSKYSKK